MTNKKQKSTTPSNQNKDQNGKTILNTENVENVENPENVEKALKDKKKEKSSVQPDKAKSEALKKSEKSSDILPKEKVEKKEKKEKKEKLTKDEISNESVEEKEETKEHEEHSVFSEDLSHNTKQELISLVKLKKNYDILDAHKLFQYVEPYFNEIVKEEKKLAFDKYMADGGEKDGFEYTNQENESFYSQLKTLKKEFKQLKHTRLVTKRNNTNRAEKIIDEIREVLKGEETKKSIEVIRKLQGEWRAMDGFLPERANELYKTYNALLDLYYDNRSIYFDLKDLDRQKNLEKKEALCVKVEKLSSDSINVNTFKTLKELHLEYKQIGPVPRENNEPLWNRFKKASDTIHDKKIELDKEQAKKRDENFEIKSALLEKIIPFTTFQHDKFVEWNKKTTEIKAIQKEWESTGALPRVKSKDVSKEFWAAYKLFFKNKSLQFKKEDHKRNENLVKKKALITQVEQLKDSKDWEKTANTLKKIQQDWKNIGPVNNKVSDEIFKQFRALCNQFFESLKEHKKEQVKSYDVNLKLKNEIIEKITKLNKKDHTFDDLKALTTEFSAIGFVPYKEVENNRKKYEKALSDALTKLEVSDHLIASFMLEVDINNIKSDSNPERLLNDKKRKIRSKIAHLEKEIALFENNLSLFFRPSNKKKKNEVLDKKLGGFSEQIEEKEKKIEQLKRQLKILNKLDFEEKNETDS